MKITLESTPETAKANGLPVRVWSGTTERGSPVLALITRLAVPDDAHPDDIAQVERELTEAPTRVQNPGGSTVAAPRFCSNCLALGVQRPATHVARDPSGFEWFECGNHDARDNLAETQRVALEPIDAWFERAVAHVEQRIGRERREPTSEASWLVKDFWVLYSAARQLNESLITALDDAHAELECDEVEGSRVRGELIARHHQGLALQLQRLEGAFAFCESVRRSEPAPATPPELADRARARITRPDVFALRSIVSAWLHSDELNLVGPASVARMILVALDALAILHGPEAEAEAVELDAFVARTNGAEGTTPPPPRALTVADREALAGLHRWLHHPSGDGDLVEAAEAFHIQCGDEQPDECERLDAEINLEQRAEREESDERERLSLRVRDVFRKVGVSLDVPAHELIGGMHEQCTPEPQWPPPPHAALIIRTIVDDERVSGKDVAELAAATFLAEALRGARMGWHGRLRHAHELERLAEVAAPTDEPARTPWLFGFHVATTAEPGCSQGQQRPDPADVIAIAAGATLGLSGHVAVSTCRVCGCTDLDCSGCIAKTGTPCHWVEPDLCSACSPPATFPDTRPKDITGEPILDAAGPLVLTDAMRELYRIDLCYRAPETLNVHERRIIAAVEAEETERATSPDMWLDRGGS